MAKTIQTAKTVADLRAQVAKWRKAGETVALVPTMGALHDGHLSLIALAKQSADRVVVSIFVNPTQFGPREDYRTYPRDEAGDLDKLGKAGVDLVFLPEMAEMYPEGFSTTVKVCDLTKDLCGAARPNHFEGVATVVTKLLLQALPDFAVFGEKDYQQLLAVRRLVRDLNVPVEILVAPIVRESDGLALSSRNAHLTPAQREKAAVLYQTLAEVAHDLESGKGCDATLVKARFKLEAAGFRVDYVSVREPVTLKTLEGPVRRARVLAAAYLGQTRLIDNVPVPLED
jgi:pantoate--beta-alanine ligase